MFLFMDKLIKFGHFRHTDFDMARKASTLAPIKFEANTPDDVDPFPRALQKRNI